MEQKERTPKDFARVVASTIVTINRVVDAVPIMIGYDFFDEKKFREGSFDKLVENVCKTNEICEKHIRLVAGWRKNLTKI
jgi:hypothetical protein